MSRTRNRRQKRAVGMEFTHRAAGTPVVPIVEGVDFAPYQAWAQDKLGFVFSNPSLLVTALTHQSAIWLARASRRVIMRPACRVW